MRSEPNVFLTLFRPGSRSALRTRSDTGLPCRARPLGVRPSANGETVDQVLPKPVSGASRRALTVALIVGLGLIGGTTGCGKGGKFPAISDSKEQVTTTGSKDISEEDLRGIFNYMPGEDFQKVIGKLGRPALTGRQMPAPRSSCKYMAAWKKNDGSYLLLHWLESTEPNGGKRVVNFRTWDNQTLRQVEDLKPLLK